MGDKLFDDEGDNKNQDQDGDKKSDTKPASGLTADQVQAIVKDTMDGFSKRLGKDLGSFGDKLVDYIQEQTNSGSDKKSDDTVGGDTGLGQEAEGLLRDPKAIVTKYVEDIIKEKLGPYLATQISDRHTELLVHHRAEIDKEYGDGVFDKEFAPDLDEALGKLPPESKSSAAHIRALVEGIVGRKAKELRNMANEIDRKRKEDEQAVPVMLSTGLPARPRGGRVTEADRTFARDYEKATGEELPLKDLVAALDKKGSEDRPWTLDDFPKEEAK